MMLFPHDVDIFEEAIKDGYPDHGTNRAYSGALRSLIQLVNGNLVRDALSRSKPAPEMSDVFDSLRERAARECFSEPDLQMSYPDRLWRGDARAFREGAWAHLDLGHLADDENVKAFLAKLPGLLAEGHKSKFAAFADGKLVGIDADFETLCDNMERLHPEDSILIQQIDTCAPQVQLPSPKLL